MAYATETEKYAKESSDYLNEVHQAKSSGRWNKMITLKDPLAERYSQAADDDRQQKAILRVDGQNEPDAPRTIDLGEPGTSAQPREIDLSDSQPERSRTLGETYQSHRPNWNAPPKTGEHPVAKDAARVLNALSPITNSLQELAAPFETLGDYYRGLISPKTTLPGIGREGSYAGPQTTRELNPSIDEAAQAGDSVTALIREFATGIMSNPAFVGMSPLLRRPQVPTPISKYDLKVLSAEEMLGGQPSEIARPGPSVANPEAIPYAAGSPSAYTVKPTGRFVLPTGTAPDITDLAQAHQAKVLEGSRTGAFYDPSAPPMSITHDTVTPARTDRFNPARGVDVEMPDVVQPFEKSRALRTAEEMVQERQTMESRALHGKRDQQIREANAYIPTGSSVTASEGAAEGATQALRAITKRDAKRQALKEQANIEFAKQYVEENLANQRAQLQAPVRLESGPLPKQFDNLSAESMFPSVVKRIDKDVLSAIGEFSPAWKGASESILKTYEMASKQTMQSINDFTEHVSSLFGERPWMARKGMAFKELTRGENIAINSAQRSFNLNPAVEEAAFNYLYTKGAMQPPHTLSAAEQAQAIQYAKYVYEDMLFPTSSHPGVRQIKVYDPYTGEMFEPGQPSMFVAHQPIKEMTRSALKDKQWELLYNRMGGQARTQVSLEKFIERVVNFSKRDPEVGAGIFNMPNLEQKRLVDLSALGGSPYQHAKAMGYETDLFAMAVRHRTNGVLRGELQLLKPGIDSLLAATQGLEQPGARWLSQAVNYAMKVPHGMDHVQPYGTDVALAVRRWTDMALLGKAYLTNMTQFAYPLARSMGTPILGAKANVKGIADYIFGANKELIKDSGALLPSVLNEFSHPVGPLAVWHSNVMKMYGLPNIDRNTRLFAGHIGNRYVTALENHFLANPTSKTHAAILNELGGPAAAKTILTEGKVNDQLRLEMIQRFANQTAGVLDARGLPWYATSENPYAKVVLQYKPFLMANSTEINRSIANAPTKAVAASRFAALMLGGGATATAIFEMKELFNHLVQGPAYAPPPKDTKYVVENIIAGFGGAYSAAAIDIINNPVRSAVGGMVPSVGYLSGFAQDLKASVQHGPGWRSLKTASELPVVGTVTAPYVRGKAKAEAQALREAGQ